MSNQQLNPWKQMNPGTKRRVEYNTIHDYFWIVDFNRRFGFFMKLEISEEVFTDISLRGIDIIFEKNMDDCLEIFLFLENREEAEVFQALCFDLIFTIDIHESDLVKISKLLERIDKWKSLLANRRTLSMSVEQQMGIFSELYCLKYTISKGTSYSVAINAWVGMEKDKQDFNLHDSVVEVKSHRTTKGNIAIISSVNQLYSEKDKFYLISYGLTMTEQGKTIDNIFDEIMENISGELSEILIRKLFESGWVPHHDKLNKEKFTVDSETIYSVEEEFPKINYETIDLRITEVKYKIDLSKCCEYICSKKDVFGGE